MALSDVISQTITRTTRVPKRAGFGVPAFFCFNAFAGGLVNEVEEADDVLDLGATIYHPAYKAAVRCFAQTPRPEKMLIVKRETFTQIVHILPVNTTEGYVYEFTITDHLGVETAISYTVLAGASVATIVTALRPLIDAVANVVATDSTTHVTCTSTANTIAQYSDLPPQADMTVYVATVAGTLAANVTTFLGSLFADDAYAFTFDHAGEAGQIAVAAVVEAVRKMAFFDTSDSEVIAGGDTDDIASQMKALSYARSVAFYLGNETNGLQSVGLCGRCLPFDPGTETWAHKSITGIAADALLSSAETALETKRAMSYTDVAGLPVTLWGQVPDGDYIDTIRGVDMLFARIAETVYGGFYANSKIPFTDDGIAVIEGLVRSVLDANVSTEKRPKLLASYTITVPLAADVELAQKAARTLPDIRWSATLAGAVHKVVITGNVGL